MAVDFSSASGADAVIVMTGPGAKGGKPVSRGKVHALDAGGRKYSILILSAKRQFPEPTIDNDTIRIGGQTYAFDGKNLVIGKNASR